MFDLDGTLAPIVRRPEAATVPSRTRELVARIAGRYALAGVVTGRRALEARRIVGLEELVYVGNHGFELLAPGAEEADPAPGVAGMEGDAIGFLEGVDPAALQQAGIRVEDKGAIQALHWRGAADERAAEEEVERLGAAAAAAGLHAHRGRKVLEIRPPVELDKGTGLRGALANREPDAALYAGDDATDVDAFAALAALVEEGGLERAVRIAVLSEEGPAADLARASDLAVEGAEGMVAVLEALA